MAPPVDVFPASELAERVQLTAQHRRRKPPVDLKKCELLEMIQYDCRVDEGPGSGGRGKVLCTPIERLFRR